MTKIFDKQIDRILKEKRDKAFSIAERNLIVARRNQEFLELEKQEVDKMIELANVIADEMDETKERIKLAEIRNAKKVVLKKIGLNAEDIIPQFECKDCSDTGISNGTRCVCRTRILNQILMERSGLTNSLESFEKAEFGQNLEAKKIFDLLKDWSNKFPAVTKKTVYISGETGVGKTFLLKCMANELIKNGNYLFYTTAFKMNNDFLSYCKADKEEKMAIFAPYLDCDILLIDDLGTEPILNNVTLDYLYLVLNERLLADKATVINSNLDMDKLIDRYGERIFSRIINKRSGLAIKFTGADLRLKK